MTLNSMVGFYLWRKTSTRLRRLKDMTRILLISALLALPVAAQLIDNQERTLACNERSGNSRQEHFCEIRESTITAVPKLAVDGKVNGGVNVKGWSRGDILVRAKVDTWAPSRSEAQGMAGQVSVRTAGGNIFADAPEFDRDRGWAVSYEVFVPHRTGLNLKAHNGGIRISDVVSEINFQALNGGVKLARLGGNVYGSTTNGGLDIDLMGSRWDGNELNVRATNGGVSLRVPDNYNARVETATVNGRVSTDFPVTMSGRLNRDLAFNIGSGGPRIRAVTTNGGVSIKRASGSSQRARD
jgi:hypothetical protein